jgi:hypothetical protein
MLMRLLAAAEVAAACLLAARTAPITVPLDGEGILVKLILHT